MQTNSVNQHRGISKADLLRIAPFSKRQLAVVYRAGLLPRPQRRSQPGSKKPVYYWDEPIGEQATLLYELLQWCPLDHRLRLPLWLRGYQVDIAPLRQGWLNSIDAFLLAYTQGETGDPRDNISDVISGLEYKWEHTPTPHRPEDLRQLGPAALALAMELFLNVLLVPDYEPDETEFAQVLASLRAASGRALQQQQEKASEDFFSWLPMFQEILAFPRLREALEQATPAAWEQARVDYLTFCQFAKNILAPVAIIHPVPEIMYVLLSVAVGLYLVPIAVAMRYWGYGEWIDDAFEGFSELPAGLDPEEQARLEEQLAQRRAKSPG
jgi:hypothetical protein